MNTKGNLQVLLICELFSFSKQSITGVTYRDHFDFNERSHDDCNPLYWHPLHMPDHCIEMYEKLIRSKLYNTYPYPYSKAEAKLFKRFNRVIKSRRRDKSVESDDDKACSTNDNDDESYDGKYTYSSEKKSSEEKNSEENKSKEIDTSQLYTYTEQENGGPPYQKMLNMMRGEVMSLPAMPVIGMLPPFGFVTIYRQPVSKKTKDYITKMSAAYASETQTAIKDYYASFFPNLNFTTGHEFNETINENNVEIEIHANDNKKKIEIDKVKNDEIKLKINKFMKPFNARNKAKIIENEGNTEDNNKEGVITKKIKHGNMVAYFQKKRNQV